MFRVSYLWSFPLCCRSKGISPSLFAFLGRSLSLIPSLAFCLSSFLSVPSSIPFLCYLLLYLSHIPFPFSLSTLLPSPFLYLPSPPSFPHHLFPIFRTFLNSLTFSHTRQHFLSTSVFLLPHPVLYLFLYAVNLTY